MTALDAFLLGIIQGLTEFLPISSSGHLIVAETLLDLHIDPQSTLTINILLHTGTLLALCLVYQERWWRLLTAPFTGDRVHQKLLLLLVTATVPAGVAGVLLSDVIALHLGSVASVSVGFLVTAVVLWLGERSVRQRNSEHISHRSALLIGVAQAFALVPGLSRSGLTISAGRVIGLTRQEALDFSFLMAVPVIAGATVLAFLEIATQPALVADPVVVSIGFLSSLASSVLAILWLRRFVLRYSLTVFCFYLVPISLVLFAAGR